MDYMYNKCIADYIKEKSSQLQAQITVTVGTEPVIKKFCEGDWSFMPCITVRSSYEYINADNACSYDFTQVLPAKLCPEIEIITEEISDIIEIEKFLSEIFSNAVSLSVADPYNSETIIFNACIDKSIKITRSRDSIPQLNNREYNSTTIPLVLDCNALFMRDFHPAEIEYKKEVQLQLVKRGKALEQLKEKINTFSVPHQQQINTAYNQIVSLLGLEILTEFGFSEIFEFMKDNRHDIKSAIAECQKNIQENKRKAEEERQRIAEQQRQAEQRKKSEKNHRMKINQLFSKNGDSITNRYTDGVVSEIQKQMNFAYQVLVYGGSTFAEWQRLNALNELAYPNILVKDRIRFVFEHKAYKTVNGEGSVTERPLNTKELPIHFGFNLEIHAKNKQQLEEISTFIKAYYKEEKVAIVALPAQFPCDERLYVGITFSSDIGDTRAMAQALGLRMSTDGKIFSVENSKKNVAGIVSTELSFVDYQNVYFIEEYNKADIENNQRLQANLLRLAVFYGECSNKLSEAAEKLEYDYKTLVSGKNSFFNMLNSADFKRLKYCYDNRMPLDNNLFNSVFKTIVEVYPNLYEKTIQGFSFEQVKADILKYSAYFNDEFVSMFQLLGVPTEFAKLKIELPYSFDNLRAYAGRLDDNAELSLNEAIHQQEEERIVASQREREAEARAEERMQNIGGFGILSGLAHSAINNAQNRNRNTSNSGGSSGKQSLWGTAMCPWGQKAKKYDSSAPDFMTIRCGIGCPMYTQCGGKK